MATNDTTAPDPPVDVAHFVAAIARNVHRLGTDDERRAQVLELAELLHSRPDAGDAFKRRRHAPGAADITPLPIRFRQPTTTRG